MKISWRKKVGLAIVAAALAVAPLAGCQESKEDSAGTIETAPGLPNTARDKVEADQVQDGGTLTLSLTQLPDNWNYYQLNGALYDLARIREPLGGQMYLIANEAGEVSFDPNYIESATLKQEDPTVVEVKYNKNAVWEDGTPITINDLQSNWKATNGTNPDYQVASTVGWEKITSIEQTEDEFTGEITFSEAYVDWQPYVYPDTPAAISDDPAVFNEGYVTKEGKSTPSAGPYKVKEIDVNNGIVTLEKNDKWWGDEPKLDTIIFKVTSGENEPSAFANSELDAIEVANGDVMGTAKGRADAKIMKSAGLTWSHVTLNTTRGAMADVEVRKAIFYAINREAIGQAVVGPLEAPVVLVNNYVYMPGQKGYEDSFGGELKSDKAKAEQILQDAGYAKGDDGIYAKDGQKLEFSVVVPQGTKSNTDRATQIMNDLNAIGMKVALEAVPSDQYFVEYVAPKNFDMVTFSWVGTIYPVNSAGNLFYPVDSGQNFTGYADDAVGKAFEEANQIFDAAKRIEKANEASKLVADSYVILPFYATPNVWAIKDGLVNYGPSLFESTDWTVVGWKK